MGFLLVVHRLGLFCFLRVVECWLASDKTGSERRTARYSAEKQQRLANSLAAQECQNDSSNFPANLHQVKLHNQRPLFGGQNAIIYKLGWEEEQERKVKLKVPNFWHGFRFENQGEIMLSVCGEISLFLSLCI